MRLFQKIEPFLGLLIAAAFIVSAIITNNPHLLPAAVLGTLIDRVAGQTLLGAAWGGATGVTVNHSLATNPDFVWPVGTSFQTATAFPALGALRGNSTINTVQAVGPSVAAASQPTIAFDVISVKAHSFIS